MFNDIHYFGLVSSKVCVIENKFPTGKGKYEYINVGWYSTNYEHMSQIPCIVSSNTYSVTTPFNKRGRQTVIKVFGNVFMMFEGYMTRQTMPAEVMAKRAAIMFDTLDQRMDRSLSVVENASTKFFSVEGMLLLFWQLRYFDCTTSEECLMGEIPDITSLSDVDVHNYMRVHLLNSNSNTMPYFDREIAKVAFSPARSVVLSSFYDINETSFVNQMSYVVDKVAHSDGYIVSKRQLPFSEVTPASGYCLPDGAEYVVWRRNSRSTEGNFVNTMLCKELMDKLLERNVELFPVKPFVFSHHAEGNHFMAVYHFNVYMPKCKITCLTSTTLSIMKQASRALDDYAYFGSPGSYRVIKTLEHFRYLFQVHQYVRYLEDAHIDVTMEKRALSILQAAVLLSFAKPERRLKQVYDVLDSFCDSRLASDSDLISMSMRTGSDVFVKRSKCDGELYYGRVRTYNGGKYAAWNDYMSVGGIPILNSTDIRMAKLLPQIFEVSESTLQMIDIVCASSRNDNNLATTSRRIGMASPYAVDHCGETMAYADNAVIIVDEQPVAYSPLTAGHRRKTAPMPLPVSRRVDLVDENCDFIDETNIMKVVKVPDTMAKPMSYWATQQRRIVADQLKDERIKRNNLSQAELMRGTARPKVKSAMPSAQQSNISKILLAARAENMPCPIMVAKWTDVTDVTLPDDDGDVFYESSDGFNSDSTVSASAQEDELMERIKRLL
jgi:hypothetical protein